jgi:hypothetical protein
MHNPLTEDLKNERDEYWRKFREYIDLEIARHKAAKIGEVYASLDFESLTNADRHPHNWDDKLPWMIFEKDGEKPSESHWIATIHGKKSRACAEKLAEQINEIEGLK